MNLLRDNCAEDKVHLQLLNNINKLYLLSVKTDIKYQLFYYIFQSIKSKFTVKYNLGTLVKDNKIVF